DGTFDERIGPYAGRWVKDADPDLIEDLRSRDRLLRADTLVHSYPHCWRCGTPLLYYSKPSWYIATSEIKDRMLDANETVTWYPEHIKHGRFGNWLEGNVDWALSRERYWGTPLPVWRCSAGHLRVVGSLVELKALSGVEVGDPHRPFVDEVTFACGVCGAEMRRVPEVIDVWFDSGAMPFAQYGAPHAGTDHFERRFPADFICEALDQTRGWFYSLLAISALLFNRSPYRTVLCLGLIVDEQGRKMSKSLGNIVDPWQAIERFGADALRWYFFTSRQPWAGYRFSMGTIEESVKEFLLPLWNTYYFFVLYAEANGVAPRASARAQPSSDLDRWLMSRLQATIAEVRSALDDYDATSAGRAISVYVDELSNWYVRRSRRRFWDGEEAAFATLERCLVTVAQLLAPFCPFLADEIYDNLDGSAPSVHLTDFPVAGERELGLEQAMATARQTVRLGLAARAQARLKIRQPLRAAIIVASGQERDAIERHGALVREELNVHELRFVSAADELSTLEVKPNYRTLGPRFGPQMPTVAAAVAGLDGARVAAAVREGRPVAVSVGGREHELESADLVLAMRPLEGYQVQREGSHAVALELSLDDHLQAEGWAREIVHAVQAVRRDAGLEVSDRIALTLAGDADLMAAARTYESNIAGETLAVVLSYDQRDGRAGVRDEGATSSFWIDGRELAVWLAKVSGAAP
ncbi:MAG: isoleucine--tRNA ligase, partial [Solirubrobacterales bacterium]|nr:isoleucine--tRNA ligase [Solirubrobacterales bacterium]